MSVFVTFHFYFDASLNILLTWCHQADQLLDSNHRPKCQSEHTHGTKELLFSEHFFWNLPFMLLHNLRVMSWTLSPLPIVRVPWSLDVAAMCSAVLTGGICGDSSPIPCHVADVSHHQWTLGPLLWLVLFEIQKSFALLLYCSLWAGHGGHSSGFLHGIVFVMFRLAGPAWVIDISEPFRDPASLKTRFAGFF